MAHVNKLSHAFKLACFKYILILDKNFIYVLMFFNSKSISKHIHLAEISHNEISLNLKVCSNIKEIEETAHNHKS